jgi:hypothetical protein
VARVPGKVVTRDAGRRTEAQAIRNRRVGHVRGGPTPARRAGGERRGARGIPNGTVAAEGRDPRRLYTKKLRP